MAKIQNVDYVAIPKQAKQMRVNGQELNSQITTAYQSIEDMHSSWYGKRYNELVKQFNDMTQQINEMLKLVVTDIPSTLEKVANNYSQADRGQNATTVSNEAPKKVSKLNAPNDVGMKFMTEDVRTTKSKVSNNFKNAKSKMDEIANEFAKVKWDSEAATAFRKKFNKLKQSLIKSFEDIEKEFTKLMNQTIEDIQHAENANTVQ